MEKKVTKKFYLISAFNLFPIVILAWPNVMDMLVLAGILVALVINHSVLVKIISQLSLSMTSEGDASKSAQKKMVALLFIKMTLLGGVLALGYFYNPALLPKVMLIMIFQLIIQVVSIKNNY